ncbi:2'-5' RNA ligase family protein [Lyngbya aestuarii]|uniref:2'-5' RNA ligase family protein n=1 Tax=Lyngbya aestuarii TaxID=118322 RepID=UPI00403D7B0A
MDKSKHRFFIALLPPQAIQDYAQDIQQYFAQNYGSQGALNSPPHITLQPPFEWQLDQLSVLEKCLTNFTQIRTPVPITFQGFSTFAPRVIYINVLKTVELLTLQTDLMAHLEVSLEIVHQVSRKRPFVPHLTVAFRDLTQQNFRNSWPEFEQRELNFEFTASELALLIHDGRRWNVSELFPLLAHDHSENIC